MALSGRGMSTQTIRSFRKAARNINKAARELGGELGPALRMIGEEIMTDVKDSRPGHGVPVDEGTLRGTGRVTGPTGNPKAPSVTLDFGGAAAPYALVQHENMRFKHTVGEARYLVRGMERWRKARSAAWQSLKERAKAALKEK